MTRKELIAQLTAIAEVAATTPATQSAASILFCLIGALAMNQTAVEALADLTTQFSRARLREIEARQKARRN